MKPFRDLPIARKALLLGVVPTACALLLATLVFVVTAFVSGRSDLARELETDASIAACQLQASLAFRDPQVATDLLRAFGERPDIDAVCVFDASGALFASYSRDETACGTGAAGALAITSSDRTVSMSSRTLGSVRVRGNLRDVYMRAAVQTGVATAALAGGILLAVLLTRRLQTDVVDPVISLARSADVVSQTGDYTVRARVVTDDEVGGLVRSFNAMLERIQAQNEALVGEIASRQRAEEERTRLLERERQASRLKDEFLAAVSHELRTPLNAILGWAQVLAVTRPDEQTFTKGLETVRRNAQAQARVIEDLLDVSRIVTGKLHLTPEPVDLRTVVDAAMEVIGPPAAAKQLRVSMQVPEVPCPIQGDRTRLQQVFWNLLSNAVKFTPTGGNVAVKLYEANGSFCVSVSDSGIGMHPRFLPHAFDRFRQADGSTTREHGGLGLGLAIVKELVELHGGRVSVTSDGAGHGSEFVVQIPRASSVAARNLDAEVDSPRAPLEGLHILVVDDNPDALDVAVAILSSAGAHVHAAASGHEGIERWKREPADVLLCDLGMPAMDGFEVLRRIRDLDASAGRATVAVAVTAYVSDEHRARARRAGFQLHVAKPFSAAELIEAVTSALQRV